MRQILGDTETKQVHTEPQKQIPKVAEIEMQRHREPEKRHRYWETLRQSRAKLNLKDRYRKSQRERERCRGTENLKRECETDTGRHRDKAGPH